MLSLLVVWGYNLGMRVPAVIPPLSPRPRSMREVMDALEWVRPKVFMRGSPDFIRARQLEARVAEIAKDLLRERRRNYRKPPLRNGR